MPLPLPQSAKRILMSQMAGFSGCCTGKDIVHEQAYGQRETRSWAGRLK